MHPLFTLACSVFFSVAVCLAEEWSGEFARAVALLEAKPVKVAQVQAIARSLPASWQQLLLIEQARVAGDHDSAAQRIDRIIADPTTDAWGAEPLVALSAALSRTRRLDEALNILNQVYARTGDVRRARTAIAAADVEVLRDNYADALSWLDLACLALREASAGADDSTVVAQINDRRERYGLAREAMRHGLGYVLLKRARQQHAQGSRKQALATLDDLLGLAESNRDRIPRSRLFANAGYDEAILRQAPIESVYEETAAFLRCRLLFELSQTALGLKSLTLFRDRYPNSVYLGEVAVLFGDEELYAGGSPAVARQRYSEAIAWLQDESAVARAAAGFAVPEDAIEVVAPPRSITRTDDWGNRSWSRMQPEDLFNVSTCAWYRQFVLMSVFAKRALCHHLLGQREQAVADLDAMAKVDPASITGHGGVSAYFSRHRRLSADFRAGRLYAMPAEAAAFTGKNRVRLALADLHTELELWDEAADAYTAMQNDVPPAARAYLSYVLAFCDVHRGRLADTNRRLDSFFATPEFAKTVSWVRAMVLRSDLQTGPAKITTLLEALAHCPPDMALSIRFRIGQQAFCLGDYAIAREHFALVARYASEGDDIRLGAVDLLDYMSAHPIPLASRP